MTKLGDFTPLTCSDCGGVIVKIKDEDHPRYRCFTGHTFTEKFLEAEQLNYIEESLWVSIRMMEERKNLLLNMISYTALNDSQDIVRRDEHIKEMQRHIDTLRAVLLSMNTIDVK